MKLQAKVADLIWEVKEAPFYSEHLAGALEDGWEPFGVIPGETPGFNDRVALRRLTPRGEHSQDTRGDASYLADKSVLCVADDRVYPEHDWSRAYDGWIMGEAGKQTMEIWKVACLRCGHIEQREAPFPRYEA